MTPGARGDLLVVERMTSSFVLGEGHKLRTSYEAGRVTSITRERLAKRVEIPGYSGSWLTVELNGTLGYGRTWIEPKANVDVERALEAVRAHHWPGHPDSPMPFETLAEIVELLRSFRT